MTVVRLYPVLEGRCQCCGRQKPTWTPDAIMQAIKDWAAVHGHGPTKEEWRRATPFTPAYQTVYEMFGSLIRANQLAGVKRTRKTGVTHCRHGHEYTPANTYIDPRGHRMCRRCRADKARDVYAKSKEAA